MNGVYDLNQTSGYDWISRRGARLYHRQRVVPSQTSRIQLSELAGLETEMERYEDEHRNLIRTIRTLYVLQDDESVSEYLQRHRTIPPVLVEAERHLRQFFKDSVLSLRASADEQGWDMLYAIIQWPGEPEDALRSLNAFDDAWWLANSYPAGSGLTFTYRLV
jgi:hypothetical protein